MRSIFDELEEEKTPEAEESDEDVSGDEIEDIAGEQVLEALQDKSPRQVVVAIRNLVRIILSEQEE